MKKKSNITSLAARRQAKTFEATFDATFRRLFEPAFDAVLLAAGILDDGDTRLEAVFDAVHSLAFEATCEILGVRSTPCAAHAKR